MSGFILYNGPSVLDGEPIVVIATLKTNNPKTGDMVQTWILRADMSPTEAIAKKADGSICGSCPHRHALGGACYVNPWQAPLAVYKAFQRGSYALLDQSNAHKLDGRRVRLGAYGDPAAVPYQIWAGLLMITGAKWTGYTHQASHRNFDSRIAGLCMVSADTPKQARQYQNDGFRTFRVKTNEGAMLPDEVYCPADQGAQCSTCGLCNGRANNGDSVAINIHGARGSKYSAKFSKANQIGVINL